MKWHTASVLALVLVVVPACAQLEKVLDACMVGVVGPRAEVELYDKPSALSSFNQDSPWPGPSFRALSPRLRLSLAASNERN